MNMLRSIASLIVIIGASSLPLPAQETELSEWFPFGPPQIKFSEDSVIDLRYLNESYAGENGWIRADGHRFIHGKTGEPVRFWGVNGLPWDHYSMDDWKYLARLLAKYGVNQLRLHGSLLNGFAYTRTNQSPDIDPMEISEDKLSAMMMAVAAMKEEGIYTHLSIYFPLWLQPAEGDPDFAGYDGATKPFAAIYFNEELGRRYDFWWQTLLTRVNPHTGIAIKDDPAVMSLELVNEDSLFFDTFSYKMIPAEQMALLETHFADWLTRRYGSVSEITWLEDHPHKRDDLNAGRIGFVDLKTMANRKSQRDLDTVRFLFETQRQWYQKKIDYLRELGFKGLITASNWQTANDFIYDSLERGTYLVGDFIDHHKAYFSGGHDGQYASWSIRNGHTYNDRNQLTFEGRNPARKDPSFEISFIKPTWNNMPTMVSETAWNRPNRYRSQSPGLYAAYGALHDLDSIVHFAVDTVGRRWFVQPRYVMQMWSLLSPAIMGQFPAAALIYRKGLIDEAEEASVIELNLEEQLALKGMNYGQLEGTDKLRDTGELPPAPTADISIENKLRSLTGKIHINISEESKESIFPDLTPFIDVENKKVASLTKELNLDWDWGLLRMDAPQAQGFLITRGIQESVETRDLILETDNDILNLMAVSLDDLPLHQSKRILLQVMTEEMAFGFKTEPLETNPRTKRILDIGTDPWIVKTIQGRISISGEPVKVTVLDQSGIPNHVLQESVTSFELLPEIVYYLLER